MTSDAALSPPVVPSVMLVTRDLMFESRVEGAAQSLGIRLVTRSDAASALGTESPGCRGVLFDLVLGTTGLVELVQEFQERRQVPVVAFGSHVATTLLDEARRAGCRDVMPRSRFSATLPDLLRQLIPRS